MDDSVPLVVPEVNPEDIFKHRGIIANPNCSTIQMVVALKPLHDKWKIRRVVVATYQSVTGAGKPAVNQLEAEIANEKNPPRKFPHQIAYNVLPQIDVFFDDGYTKEESVGKVPSLLRSNAWPGVPLATAQKSRTRDQGPPTSRLTRKTSPSPRNAHCPACW